MAIRENTRAHEWTLRDFAVGVFAKRGPVPSHDVLYVLDIDRVEAFLAAPDFGPGATVGVEVGFVEFEEGSGAHGGGA